MRGCPNRAGGRHFVANVLCWRKHRTGLAPILDDDFSNIAARSRTRDLAKAARCEGRIALKRNHGLRRCRYGGMNGEKQRIGWAFSAISRSQPRTVAFRNLATVPENLTELRKKELGMRQRVAPARP